MIRKSLAAQVDWVEYYNATTSDRNFGQVKQLETGPRTVLALLYPEGSGEGTSGVFLGQVPSGGSTNGPRFSIEDNSGAPGVQLRYGSSGTSNFPARNSANGVVTYNAWNLIGCTHDGGLTASTGMRIYNGINGAAIAEVAYGGAANGTGTLLDGTGNNFHIGNREDTDRTFNGSIAYVAQWNRVLTLQELGRAQRMGPLSVPGIRLLWANGYDYGPYSLRPQSTTDIARRARPVYYAPLGVMQRYIPLNEISAATFNAAWNGAANTVYQPGAMAA